MNVLNLDSYQKTWIFLPKRRRAEVAKEILDYVAENRTFIKCLITGEKTWVHEYNVKTVQQPDEWPTKNESKSKKPKVSKGTEGHQSRGL